VPRVVSARVGAGRAERAAGAGTDAEDMRRLMALQIEHARRIIGARAAVLYLVVGADELLAAPAPAPALRGGQARLWTERADGLQSRMEVPFGAGVAGWVAEHDASVLLEAPEEDARFDVEVDTACGAGTARARTYAVDSLVAVSVKTRAGMLVGVVVATNKVFGTPPSASASASASAAAPAAAAASPSPIVIIYQQSRSPVALDQPRRRQVGACFSSADERLLRLAATQAAESLTLARACGDDSGAYETVDEAVLRTRALVGCDHARLFIKVPPPNPLHPRPPSHPDPRRAPRGAGA
jgi:hypothetical protein